MESVSLMLCSLIGQKIVEDLEPIREELVVQQQMSDHDGDEQSDQVQELEEPKNLMVSRKDVFKILKIFYNILWTSS